MNLDKLPKFLANYVKRFKFPVIVKFQDHHEEFMHYAEDSDELGLVFLHVLKSRIDNCFYFDDDAPEHVDEEILTLEQIEKLPKRYREDALKRLKEHQEDTSSAKENNRIYAMAKKAVKEKDGAAAYECLSHHRGYEDEDFDIISIESLRV